MVVIREHIKLLFIFEDLVPFFVLLLFAVEVLVCAFLFLWGEPNRHFVRSHHVDEVWILVGTSTEHGQIDCGIKHLPEFGHPLTCVVVRPNCDENAFASYVLALLIIVHPSDGFAHIHDGEWSGLGT